MTQLLDSVSDNVLLFKKNIILGRQIGQNGYGTPVTSGVRYICITSQEN